MSGLDRISLANAKSKGKRPYFFKDPDVERVMSIVMAVAGEVAVMRERMDTIERLLDKKGTISRADIEAFEPTLAEGDERQRWHQEYIARILRIVTQELEAIEAGPADQDVSAIADELATE